MKHITFSPTGLISLLLSLAILINTSSPALAQKRIPPTAQDIEAKIRTQVPAQVTDNETLVRREQMLGEVTQMQRELNQGTLTPQQLNEMSIIRHAFEPTELAESAKSDFEIFQEMYNQEIDTYLKTELKGLDVSRAESQRQIETRQANRRNEIYTSLFDQITQYVLTKASSQAAQHLTASLGKITFNTKQDIGPQIHQFALENAADEEERTLLDEISQIAQHSADEHMQVVENTKQEEQQLVNDWYNANVRDFNQWKQEALSKTKQVYEEEYLPQLIKEREEFVQSSIDKLWKYKEQGQAAGYLLQQVALAVAPMTTPDGKSFLTDEQKAWLTQRYQDDLRNAMDCDLSRPHSCEKAWTAIAGLSLLTDGGEAASDIRDFMEKNRDSELAVPTILVGTAALISMKAYNVLESFLIKATRDEKDYSDMDWLSVNTYVNVAANKNGQYLGKVSQHGQYPLEEENSDSPKVLGNVWEDMATLLAQDGSPEALRLLYRFGVETCSVIYETNISFEREPKMNCGGIVPFLVGALTSGKSGANEPRQTTPIIAGQQLNATGTTYISQQDAQRRNNQAFRTRQQLFEYAKQAGLTPTALIARHLFNQSMGDLDAETELRLDEKMHQVFQQEMKEKTISSEFNITPYTRTSPEFAAKRLRQDRTQAWRKIAFWADLAIIAWCLFDLGRLAYKGIKLASALTKVSSMARRGATVAQRAAMLKRLNIAPQARSFVNFPKKLQASARPVVLAQMSQFTNQAVKLPTLPGAVKSLGALTAENLALSSTGGLLINYQGLRAGGLTAKEAFTVKNSVETANLAANTTFANGTRFSLRRQRSYRSILQNSLKTELTAQRAFTPEDVATITEKTASLNATIPSNILDFKSADLFTMTAQTDLAGAKTSTVSLSALAGLMKTAYGVTPSAAKVEETAQLVNQALFQTNLQYASAHRFLRLNKSYKGLFANNLNAVFDKQGRIFKHASDHKFLQTLQAAVTKDNSLQAPTKLWKWRGLTTQSKSSRFVPLGTAMLRVISKTNAAHSDQILPQELPLTIQADSRLGLVNKRAYQRVTFTPLVKDGKTTVEIGLDGKMLQNFKISLSAEEVPELILAAAQTNAPLSIKISASTNRSLSSLWNNIRQTHRVDHKRFFLRERGELFSHEIPLQIRQADGTLQSTRITLLADTHLGWRNAGAILDGKNMAILRDGILLNTTPLSYSLPKHQLPLFLNIVRANPSNKPFSLTFVKGKNKILPLMLANGLSLSSASSGLIVPLQKAYGDQITETDTMWISLALPYIPALASPVISPFVMRYGALKVLKTSLATSLAGLLFASSFGFRGYATKQETLPPIWPLFVSGAAIGVSASLSRSSLNLLIDGMGGGGSLLKSMAAKNIGSFALLLPPFVFNFLDKDIDFSLAFPVLSSLSLGMLGWVSATRVDSAIGRVANFRLFKNHGLLKEGWSAIRLLGTREVLPLVLATTAFTGFESAAFYKAGNQLFNPTVEKWSIVQSLPESNRRNATALMTTGFIQLIPMLTRLAAPHSLDLLRNPAVIGSEYQRMLKLSYMLNIAGGSVLFASGLKNDNVAMDILGLGLMGIGTANMTQSLQKLSNINVLRSNYVLGKIKGLTGAEKAVRSKAMVTKTMTGFSVSQIGLATVPLIVGRYTDRQIAEGIEKKPHAARSSLWIPLISIGISTGFAGPAIGLLPKYIPVGLFGTAKAAFGSFAWPSKQPAPAPQLRWDLLAPNIQTALPSLSTFKIATQGKPEMPTQPAQDEDPAR